MTTASIGWKFRGLFLLTTVTFAGTGSQVIFESPSEAATALLGTVQTGNYARFLSIAGPQMARYWSAGDPVRDAIDRGRLLDAARRLGVKLEDGTPERTFVKVGDMERFPAPLVKTDSGWRFDGEAGLAELTTRRIRRNEVAVLEQCERFREAEFVYFSEEYGGSRVFAQKIRSTPGQHDGLFWKDTGEDDESPLGPPFAAAAFAEQKPGDGTRPLFGYYFKILAVHGPEVANGSLNYRADSRVPPGFALIAWPAEYGVDGVRSFLINHSGDVYQKDAGSGTRRLAEAMTAFRPDRSWRKVNGDE